MTKKILYLMHLDWRWIKQRPHFIAEGLSKRYDVTVVHFCSKNYLFKNYDKLNNNLRILPALRLPLYQNRVIYALNKIYLKLYFKLLIKKHKPDYIWITFPQLYDYIPNENNCKIIYDCMDLAIGFDFNDRFKIKINNLEKKVIKDASIVFGSSNYIFDDLIKKYGCKNKTFLIRNAFAGEIIDSCEENLEKNERIKIGYVGTISKWVDFKTIEEILNLFKNIEFHFIGPWERGKKIKSNRCLFYGSLDYYKIYNYIKNFNCLIVPFKLDKKIRSADPGKIYGYINYNKPIISVYYEELDYFSSFLYFYNNTKELQYLLEKMIRNGFKRKYSNSERLKFLIDNTWNKRIEQINMCLENLN